MLKRKHVIFAGAVAAAMPAVMANAATITFSFDPSDYFVATTPTGTYLPLASVAGASVTATAAGASVVLPVGDSLEYGLDVRVTNNGGLGLAAFQTGVSNSNNAAFNAATGAVVVNPFFSSLTAKGNAVNGSVLAAAGTAGSYIITGSTDGTKSTFAAAAPAAVYTGMKAVAVAPGTANFAITDLDIALQYVINAGTTGGSTHATVYGQQTFIPGVDTLSPLPVLTVSAGSVTSSTTSSSTSSTTSSSQKIISLTSTAPTTYGSQLGTAIKINGSGGSYTVGNTGAPVGVGQTTAFTATSTFSPITDKEIYALQLDKNGVAILTTNTTLIAAIVADINASETGVTASTVTGVYASLFPGYDVLLTSTAGFSASANGTAYLGLDFSQDTTDTGITVTEIAAVPEPTTATALIVGASGMLLRRRKNRELVA